MATRSRSRSASAGSGAEEAAAKADSDAKAAAKKAKAAAKKAEAAKKKAEAAEKKAEAAAVAEPVPAVKKSKEGAKGPKGKGAKGKGAKGKGGKRRGTKGVPRRPRRTFKKYVHTVFKQLMPDNSMSKRAAFILNSIVEDVTERLVREAIQLVHAAQRHTLTSKEIQNATKILLGGGEMGKGAVTYGTKAVTKYAVTTTAA